MDREVRKFEGYTSRYKRPGKGIEKARKDKAYVRGSGANLENLSRALIARNGDSEQQ